MSHAAESFLCVCCYGEFPEREASFDEDLAGPVCEGCRKDLRNASAILAAYLVTSEDKKNKIKARPIKPEDIDINNFKRFKTE